MEFQFGFKAVLPFGPHVLVVAVNEEIKLGLPKGLKDDLRLMDEVADLKVKYTKSTGNMVIDARGEVVAVIVTVNMRCHDITIEKMNQGSLLAAVAQTDLPAEQTKMLESMKAAGAGVDMNSVMERVKGLIGEGPSELSKLIDMLDESTIGATYLAVISWGAILATIDMKKLGQELACIRDALTAGIAQLPEE